MNARGMEVNLWRPEDGQYGDKVPGIANATVDCCISSLKKMLNLH